jgi:hypothetical protein
LAAAGARYAEEMTEDKDDTIRKEQGLPEDGPGSQTTPPSNPSPEAGETDKGKEKLDKIVNW